MGQLHPIFLTFSFYTAYLKESGFIEIRGNETKNLFRVFLFFQSILILFFKKDCIFPGRHPFKAVTPILTSRIQYRIYTLKVPSSLYSIDLYYAVHSDKPTDIEI